MSIILGNDTINKVYIGANPVLKIYKGSLLVVDFDNSSSSSGSSASSESSGSSQSSGSSESSSLSSDSSGSSAGTIGAPWDISFATYSQSFNLSTQEASPAGLYISPDGLNMYVAGNGSGLNVYQYSLGSAWEISTATYIRTFNLGSATGDLQGVFFRDDGLKMYMVGSVSDRVWEYDLSSAWNISTAIYVRFFGVGSQEFNPNGIFFKPDGLAMYTIGFSNDRVYRYNLTTPWNISTASYNGFFSVSSLEITPTDLFFRNDGLKMYIIGTVGDSVYEYNLSTAWNITTAVYAQSYSVAAQETIPNGLFFDPDGIRMYIVGSNSDQVHQYNLQTTEVNSSSSGSSASSGSSESSGSSASSESSGSSQSSGSSESSSLSSDSSGSSNSSGSSDSSSLSESIGDEYFNNVELLMHMDSNNSSFIDSSKNNFSITANGGISQSATQSKFGGKSAYFDGSNDYLSFGSANLSLGAGDFCVEMWIYPTQTQTAFLCDWRGVTTSGPPALYMVNNVINWYADALGINVNTGVTISNNTWTHFAVTKSGSSLRFFINGTQAGSTTTDNANYPGSGGLRIGYHDPYYFIGYMDDIRITKGVARYTSNFTPPTQAFPSSFADDLSSSSSSSGSSASSGSSNSSESSGSSAEESDTLMLLRANSNWGPTDEGPNNYYFHNADGYDAGIMGNDLAYIGGNNPSYTDPLFVNRTYGLSASGVFSTSALYNDFGYGSVTSLRGNDATDLLSQINGDFTIELWLAWYNDSTAGSPTNLQMYEIERYLRIGNIELGTALTRYWDIDYNQTVAGYKTYIAPFGTYLPYNGTPESTDDIATVAYVATSNTGSIYQGTFSNSVPSSNSSNYIHIAIVRDTTGSTYSDELRFYMDGTLIGTADLTSSGFNWSGTAMSSNPEVGIYGYASMYWPSIQYDDIRISNSVKYSGSTITVPSSALSGARSSASANTELLLHCDGGPADYGINKYYLSLRTGSDIGTLTPPASVTLDTTVKKFGAGSYSFSSSSSQYGLIASEYSSYYVSPASDVLSKLEAADQYTIEMWIRPTGTMGANGEVYLSIGSSDPFNGYQLVLMDSTNGPYQGDTGEYYNNYYSSGLRLVWVDNFYNETNFARNQYSISTSSLTRNAWTHVAIVYNSGEWRLKVNGTDSGSSILSTTLTSLDPFSLNVPNHIILGANIDKTIPSVISFVGTFNGNIDEIRFSSVDRYGSGSYTVPTAAFS